ncbi:MAG: sensor histidine kinase [Ktedonobacteraceae bacterium]
MQMTHLNHSSRPLVLLPSQTITNRYKFIIDRFPRALQPMVVYLLSIPFVSLTVRIFHFIWRVVALIIFVLSGKRVTKQRKVDQARVIAFEPETKFHADKSEQERQLKEHFLVMASHELKTPMTTILGQVQLMLRRLSNMPELSYDLVSMRTALERVNGQTRRLNALVDDLLDLYNVRAGKVQLRLEACNLVDACREVVEEQRLLTGCTIELEAPLSPIMLQADTDRLDQVVVNLISNAIKYSPEGSPVKVLVDQRRDIGIIEVCDRGPGITRDEQARIFEPFYRGSDVQTTVKSGLGLGLTICKDIVERHSGRIWCRSRLGKGSIFIVELPLGKTTPRKVR